MNAGTLRKLGHSLTYRKIVQRLLFTACGKKGDLFQLIFFGLRTLRSNIRDFEPTGLISTSESRIRVMRFRGFASALLQQTLLPLQSTFKSAKRMDEMNIK